MYSTAPAQEQGARLPASRHRWLDFLQNSGQQLFFEKKQRCKVFRCTHSFLLSVSTPESGKKVTEKKVFCFTKYGSGCIL